MSDMIWLACSYAMNSLKGAKMEQGDLEETMAIMQTRGIGGLDLGGGSQDREKWSDS